jgi:endonuclease G
MRLLLVLLGASVFPRRPDLSSPAFAASHTALRGWMLDPAHGPAVRQADCLTLFDSAQSWPDQETALLDWLADRLATDPAPTDLVIHYVGHGGFRDESRDYYLAIRATRPDNAFYSSIMVDSLWRALRSGARRLRRTLVIDACFAGAAVRALQSPLEEVVKVRLRDLQDAEGADAAREALPDRGTAVLASSSAADPSSLAGAAGLTQFTEGLLAALQAGAPGGGERLSLAELRGLVRAELRARYKQEAVLPELHAPDQRLGLPQDVPLFPNLAHRRPVARVKAAPRGRDASDIPLQMALGNPSGAGGWRDNRLITRPQYALAWCAVNGRANWVGWHLRESDLGDIPRGDAFRADPDAPTVKRGWADSGSRTGIGEDGPPVTAADYRGTGYDRGHLCPPGDRRGSTADQHAVFLMSNVVPQAKVRNQKLWHGLEEHCRALAREGWELFITAGPGAEFAPSTDEITRATAAGRPLPPGRLAEGRISVPGFLWKIALALPPGATLAEAPALAKIFAIRMANTEQARITDWRDARVTIASLEEELGYNFLDALGPAAKALKRRIEPD